MILDVDLQFPAVRANLNALIAIDNLDENRIGILFQLLHNGMENRQGLAPLLGSAAPALARNQVHAPGDAASVNPPTYALPAPARLPLPSASPSLSHAIPP